MTEYNTAPETRLGLPNIKLEITNTVSGKIDESFDANVTHEGKNVGRVIFYINKKRREIVILNIQLSQKRSKVGTSVYLKVKNLFPEYALISSQQMT